MFPELTDWKAIINKTKKYADEFWFENLNIYATNWSDIKKWLHRSYPDLVKKYEEIYFSKSNYWDAVENQIKQFCRKNKLKHAIYFHHSIK